MGWARKLPDLKEHFRSKLNLLRQEIVDVLASSGDSSAVVELDQSKVGRLSRMDAMQAQAMAQASSQRRKSMLKKITATLARIDNGDFGICQSCDASINPKRLEFDPTVLLCIECASEAEQ